MLQNRNIKKSTTPKYKATDYHYNVAWSEEDEAFISRASEFSSLAAHGDTPQEALQEILIVIEGALEDLEESGEPMPIPFPTVAALMRVCRNIFIGGWLLRQSSKASR